MTTQYIPPQYGAAPVIPQSARLPAGGSRQLDREAFIAACMASERSALTVNLSSREQIEALADRMASFHPLLTAAVNQWARSEDKESARDCLTIDGETASTRMWRQGKTFLDVVCEAQRHLDRPEGLPSMRVSLAGPEQRGEALEPQPPPAPKMGWMGRFANWALGGAWARRLAAQETQRRQEFLAETPPLASAAAHNRQVLIAEQIVRDDAAQLAEVGRARTLLEEHRHTLSEQVEKDAALDAASRAQRISVMDTIASLRRENDHVAGYLDARHRADAFEARLSRGELDIIDIDSMNRHAPQRMPLAAANALAQAAAGTTVAYDQMVMFDRFAQMTPEQLAAEPSSPHDREREQCLQEARRLSPGERAGRLSELKEAFKNQAGEYLQTFRRASEATGLGALATDEAAARRTQALSEAEARQAELTAPKNAAISGVGAHGAVVSVDISDDARLLRRIELDAADAMLRDVTQDYETMRAGLRQSQTQLTHLRQAASAPSGPAVLTNAPGMAMAGSATRSLLEAVGNAPAPPPPQPPHARPAELMSARAALEEAQAARAVTARLTEDEGAAHNLRDHLGDYYAVIDGRTTFAPNTPQMLDNFLMAAQANASARFDLLEQNDREGFERCCEQLRGIAGQIAAQKPADPLEVDSLVGIVANTVVRAVEINPEYIALGGALPEDVLRERGAAVAEARAKYEPLEQASRPEHWQRVTSAVAERAAQQRQASAPLRERTDAASLTREGGSAQRQPRSVTGAQQRQPDKEREQAVL